MLYGFNLRRANTLTHIADREGLKSRVGARVKYPKPLPDDASPFLIGKPTTNVTAPDTVTVAIYSGTPGSESPTGEEVEAYTYVDLLSTKFCTVATINGHLYAGCYEQ